MTDTEMIDGELRAKTVLEVQEELVGHLVDIVAYWVAVGQDRNFDTFEKRMSGLMHSFYVTFAGNSGGFGPSIDMYPVSSEDAVVRNIAGKKNFFPASFEISSDINDGSLQYHSAENHVDVPENSESPREWTQEEMRALLYNKVADLIADATKFTEGSEFENAGKFMRSVLSLLENGDGDFPKVALLVVSQEEDKEFYIENEENFYNEEGTLLTGQSPSLLDLWDSFWAYALERHGYVPASEV